MQSVFVRLFVAGSLLAGVTGCEELKGMTETLTTAGPVTPAAPPAQAIVKFEPANKALTCSVSHSVRLDQFRQDQYGLFQIAYACAWASAVLEATGQEVATAQANYRAMLREGLGLVRGNCTDFFRTRGDRQQVVNLSRDAVALGTATAAAVVGLTGGSALALSIIAVSGATLYSTIDTYTKNFLFGVDNIEAVATLTLKAVGEHARKQFTESVNDDLSFQYVAAAIMDNQELCKPASIVAKVREAIKSADPQGLVASGPSNTGELQDAALIARISIDVGFPGNLSVNERQLAAICWGATPEGLKAENVTKIKEVLKPEASFGTGPGTERWTSTHIAVTVGARCESLSARMQAAIAKHIAAMRGPATESSGAPAPPGGGRSASGPPAVPGPAFTPIRVR